MNPLIKLFKSFGEIDLEIEQEFNQLIKYDLRQKGEFFLKKGQSVSCLFILEKGLVRSYFIKDDKEINLWFGFENELLGSILPLYFNKPSFENIQFLEESRVYFISMKDLNLLYEKFVDLNIIGRKIAEDYCRFLEVRIISFQTESPEKRYRSLIKDHPDVLQRVSLGNIASFLGITQETLSRIRKKRF